MLPGFELLTCDSKDYCALTKTTLRSWRPPSTLLGQCWIISAFRSYVSLRPRRSWHPNLSSFSLPSVYAWKTKLAWLPFHPLHSSRSHLAWLPRLSSWPVSSNLTLTPLIPVLAIFSL